MIDNVKQDANNQVLTGFLASRTKFIQLCNDKQVGERLRGENLSQVRALLLKAYRKTGHCEGCDAKCEDSV